MTSEVAGKPASYAAEVTRLLWPEPWGEPTLTRNAGPRGPAGQARRDAYVFPSERRPRLLVPTDVPASSVMLRRLGTSGGALVGPARFVLERSVRSRAFPLVRWPMLRVQGADPGADSIERYLRECLGSDVRVGILLGTRRVNQKPVLQIFCDDGSVLGYAKVGHNPLTAQLVRREAGALATVGSHRPRTFRVPQVLHHGRWAGLEVLVISPLSTDSAPVSRQARVAATRELTRLDGTDSSTLGASDHFSRLLAAAAAVPDTTQADRLRSALAGLASRHGDDDVQLGGWHGDWGHWNMGMDRGVLNVWDWERYDRRVPMGFDALHFAAQAVRPGDRRAPAQEARFLASAPGLMAAVDVPYRRHALTLRLYLAEIAARYLDALQHGATPALRRRTDWVLSLLERQLRGHDPRQGAS